MRARVIRSCVEDERSNARAHVQVKTLLSEKSLDNPYTGGLSSFGLLLLLTRFLQHVNIMRAHEGGAAVGGAAAARHEHGGRIYMHGVCAGATGIDGACTMGIYR